MALLIEAIVLAPTAFRPVWNDQDSGADYDLQAWQGAPPAGFFLLGDLVEAATDDWIYGSQPRGALIALRDLSTDGDQALYPISTFFQTWSNRGAYGGKWGSVWSFESPGNSVAVGSAINATQNTPPSTGIYCAINPALLLDGQIGPEIWSTQGAHVQINPMTLWQIVQSPNAPQGIAHGSFILGVDNSGPMQPVRTLDPAYLQWQSS